MAAITTAVVAGAAVANTAYQGKKNREAAEEAAQIQADAATQSGDRIEEANNALRDDLAPYRAVGETAIPLLQQYATRSEADRVASLENDPLFEAALNSRDRVSLGAAATQGRVGTGGFSKELSENFLLTAAPILQSRDAAEEQRLLNLAQIGQSSAAQTGTAGLNAANSASNAYMGGADATSAGVVASQQANANTNAAILNNLPTLIGAIENVGG